MDINDITIKEEVNNLVYSLQKLLPKKKDIIVIEPFKPKLTRLADVHLEAKNVFPRCFIGAKLVVLRQVLDRVKLVQHYNFGRPKESYKCFTHPINKEMEPKPGEDGLLIDSSGSATATYKERVDDSYEMRITSKIKDLVSSETEILVEKDTSKSVGSLALSMRDVDPNTLKLVTQWMYKVHPEFGIGAEVNFKPLAYPPVPDLSISARYERPSYAISTTVSKVGYQICFFKQFAKDLRIASIVNEGQSGAATILSLAMHKSFENGAELKIFVDTQHCGGFTFQKDVLFHEPHNEVRVLRLDGSVLIDRQRRLRCGFGFNMDF